MVISPVGCRSASSIAVATTRSRLSCGVARGGGGPVNQIRPPDPGSCSVEVIVTAPYQEVYVVHMSGRRTRSEMQAERRADGGGSDGGRGAGGGGRAGRPDHRAAAAAPRGRGDPDREAAGHLTAAQGAAVSHAE